MLTRRGFINLFGATIAGVALDQAIPFGRVYSFPTAIRVVTIEEINEATIQFIMPRLADNVFQNTPLLARLRGDHNIYLDSSFRE